LADYEEPPSAPLYYLKGVSSWILIWLLTQLLFAVIYSQLEPEDLPIGRALYLCIVTATTVGYGDVGVRDNGSHRIFASFHILFSVSSLAALLNTVQVLHSERKIQLRKAMLLQRQLDQDLISSLDKDNNGLDKLEFVVGMLTKLEILHWDDVEPFLAQFDALDTDHSGRLDKEDLLRMVESNKLKVEAKKKGLPVDTFKNESATGVRDSARDSAGERALDCANGDDSVKSFEIASPQSPQPDDAGAIKARVDGAGVQPAGRNDLYGGIAARNRELVAQGLSPQEEDPARHQRGKPFMSRVVGLPGIFAVSSRGGRPRRPRHLRSKISPG